MKQNFELRKLRDFGQVFNDTFVFFKDNLKPLLRSLFVICGVLMLIGIVSTVATYLNVSSIFTNRVDPNLYGMSRFNASFFINIFVTAFALVITQSCISLVTLCYMSVYLQNEKQEPSVVQVWGFFKYYFWRVLGASIVTAILTGIGLVFCLLPGLYLGVVFSLVIPIIVMENASFGFAFNKSFTLIRDNWWFVFGVSVVIGIIVYVINRIAAAPMGITTISSQFLTSKSVLMPIMIFFAILQNMLLIAHSLSSIAISLCYFDLVEQKEGTGLMNRIEDFGKPVEEEKPGEEPAEEY